MMRIRVERTDGVGRITLARPEKKNALDLAAARELRESLREFAADSAVRVVLLSADGDDGTIGFPVGQRVADFLRWVTHEGQEYNTDLYYARFPQALSDKVEQALKEGGFPDLPEVNAMRRLFVAAVRGRALAGGAGLATACDIVIAHESARFGYPEVRVGFVPAMVMAILRRLVGEKRAFELVATGRQVSAAEALELGLVSRVVAAGEFDATIAKLVSDLAATPAQALRMTKRLFYGLDGTSMEDGIAMAARVNVEARATDDFREGIRRFAPGAKKP